MALKVKVASPKLLDTTLNLAVWVNCQYCYCSSAVCSDYGEAVLFKARVRRRPLYRHLHRCLTANRDSWACPLPLPGAVLQGPRGSMSSTLRSPRNPGYLRAQPCLKCARRASLAGFSARLHSMRARQMLDACALNCYVGLAESHYYLLAAKADPYLLESLLSHFRFVSLCAASFHSI